MPRSPNSHAQHDNAERNWCKTANSRRQSLKNMVAEFFGCPRFHTGMWAGEVGLIVSSPMPIGKVRKTQEAVARRRSVREAVCTYNYLC